MSTLPMSDPYAPDSHAARIASRLFMLAYQRGTEDESNGESTLSRLAMVQAWQFLTAHTWRIPPKITLTPDGYTRIHWQGDEVSIRLTLTAEFHETDAPTWTIRDDRVPPGTLTTSPIKTALALDMLRIFGFLAEEPAQQAEVAP